MIHYVKAYKFRHILYIESMAHTFDLEDRTFAFAQKTRLFIKNLSKYPEFIDDCDQLRRSSGSVGANYIEANEAISRKDFGHRIKICRKEAKESRYWLKLIEPSLSQESLVECKILIQEAYELELIFGSIIQKLKP